MRTGLKIIRGTSENTQIPSVKNVIQISGGSINTLREAVHQPRGILSKDCDLNQTIKSWTVSWFCSCMCLQIQKVFNSGRWCKIAPISAVNGVSDIYGCGFRFFSLPLDFSVQPGHREKVCFWHRTVLLKKAHLKKSLISHSATCWANILFHCWHGFGRKSVQSREAVLPAHKYTSVL